MSTFTVEFRPRALKDLRAIDPQNAKRILGKIDDLQHNLSGDVKRLTNFTPEYRLRIGAYRVLFEVDGSRVVIYRVKHRQSAYD